MERYQITADSYYSENDISEQFIRSSGPGGQNVNKVSSAVKLRFHLAACTTLNPTIKRRAAQLAGSRLTKTGEIVIQADGFRNQEQNRSDARQRLHELLKKASERQKPRIPTRPTKASKRRRVEGKVKRGSVKQQRRKPTLD